ncbi:MAG: DEAD/DEAH box helicase, partial [Flavobacteriales bacterium]
MSSVHPSNDSSAECVHWFDQMGWKPAPFQLQSWQAQASRSQGLINAPTGSGKTYACLLPIVARYKNAPARVKGLRMLWITPIRALANEIEKSTLRAIEGLDSSLTVGIRTGDTASSARTKQLKSLPNILITTPESLHLLLCSKNVRAFFDQLEVVVADEWHELMGTKRGVQVELALSRLRNLSPSL